MYLPCRGKIVALRLGIIPSCAKRLMLFFAPSGLFIWPRGVCERSATMIRVCKHNFCTPVSVGYHHSNVALSRNHGHSAGRLHFSTIQYMLAWPSRLRSIYAHKGATIRAQLNNNSICGKG